MKKKFTTTIVILTTLLLFILRDNTSHIESSKSSHKAVTSKKGSNALKKSDKKNQESPKLTEKQKTVYSELKKLYKKQLEIAKDKDVKTDFKDKNGKRYVFAYFDNNGTPRYYSNCNRYAAISTGSDLLWSSPYELFGLGMTVGVWDVGKVRETHSALRSGPGDTPSRVTNKGMNASRSLEDHSTHVTGTIIAVGLQSPEGSSTTSQGMAKRAEVVAYWLAETSAMVLEAATENTVSNKINISNHSYGTICGWEKGADNQYEWWGSTTAQEDSEFGRYSSSSFSIDQTTYSSKYLLPFCSSGNHRDNNYHNEISLMPVPKYYIGTNRTTPISFDEQSAPYPDDHLGGYDTLNPPSTAKNAITVGAIDDAIDSTTLLRDQDKDNLMTTFSSWGPCDDGRIKPDIIANGYSLFSTGAGSDNNYGYLSGTSMASPNAAGSALLLQEFFHRKSTHTMRAASLKGLILHTAYDLGRPGPDYCYGWGLMDSLKAVQTIDSFYTANSNTIIKEENLADSSTNSLLLIADGNSNITATICWTDPAHASISGLNNTTPALVNDLDMRIVQGGTIHKPWVMGGLANPSADATKGDNVVDPIEQVVVPTPQANEEFNLTVNHKDSLQNGSQDYSIIVTGIKTLFVTGNDKYIATNNQSVTESDNTYFGNVRPDQSKLNVFKIVNYSASTLTIDSLTFSDTTNFNTPQGLPITVPATGEAELYVEFSPKSESDNISGTVTLGFSNEISDYIINLSGSSTVYTAVEEDESTPAPLTPEEELLLSWGDGEINSAGNFMGSVNFTIYPGWNLLSMPFINSDSYLAKLSAKEMTAWSWNKNEQSYKIAEDVESLTGLWVYSPHESAVVLTIQGEVESSHEINIEAGWNLTGFSIGTKLSDLPENLTYYSWIAGKYRLTNEIDCTNGYWAFSKEPTKIIQQNPTSTNR